MKKDIKGITGFTGNSNHTVLPKFEKSKVHTMVEIPRYVTDAEVSKAIIKKTTGNVTVS
jgi:hypothetical protein